MGQPNPRVGGSIATSGREAIDSQSLSFPLQDGVLDPGGVSLLGIFAGVKPSHLHVWGTAGVAYQQHEQVVHDESDI